MPSCSFAELEIRSVQRIQTYTINDHVYNRIPSTIGCFECRVRPGQLHVPGCDSELCPACKGRTNYCNCIFTDPGDEELTD